MIEIISKGDIKEATCGNCGCHIKYNSNEDVLETSESTKIGGVYVNKFRKVVCCPQCSQDIELKVTYKSQVTGEEVVVNPDDFPETE